MTDERFESWAIVEVMGHSQYAGWVTEQQIGGTSFIRVDVPEVEGRQAFTKILGAGSIFCITPCSEETAKRASASFGTRPLNMLALPSYVPERHEDDEMPM